MSERNDSGDTAKDREEAHDSPAPRPARQFSHVAERDHVTIINTKYGKPFTVDGFSQWIRDCNHCRRASA